MIRGGTVGYAVGAAGFRLFEREAAGMAKSGQVIENPRRKARMTFLRTDGDTEGELLAMLAEEEPTLPVRPSTSIPTRRSGSR